MIYIAITFSSLFSAFCHKFYCEKKQLHISKRWFIVELIFFWGLVFGTFYLKVYVENEAWPGQPTILSTIGSGVAIGAVLACITILVHTYIHQIKTNKYKIKCLFTVKGFQVFPLTSFIFTLAGLLLLVVGLFIAENAVKNVPYSEWIAEDSKIWSMDKEKNYEHKTEYPLIKIKGTDLETDGNVKILVIGDSFVYGYGYSNLNYLWWNQLSNELKTRGYNCNIYGVGFEGASTYNELQWLTTTSMVADLDPDIILIGYVTNDPDLNYSEESDIPMYIGFSQVFNIPFEDLFVKLWPNIFQFFDYSIAEKLGPLGLLSDRIGYQSVSWDLKMIKGKNLSNYNSNVVEPLGNYASSIDIPIVLVTTPQDPEVEYFEARYAPVLPLFENAGIKTYNMLYDFAETCSYEKYGPYFSINPADGHPGTASTWFYSHYIADMLEENYPNILGKKTLTGKEIYDIKVNDWMPYSLMPFTISESGTSAQYVISYPPQNSSESFLTMPVKENYVKLNFKYPVDISTVTIEGEKLDSARLYVTGINADLGFDDQAMHILGEKSGRICEWADNTSLRVTSLCIHAETSDGMDEKITVKITCKEGAVSP